MRLILRHATAKELPEIANLSARAFTRDYATRAKFFLERHSGPRARPELARVLEADGVPVASVRIQDHRVRLGVSVLRLAGIADVGTDPDHRGRGYASKVMADSVRFMVHNGYDISLLFGIQDFYDRFGFVPAMPDLGLTLSVADAARLPRSRRGRGYRKTDAAALRRLHAVTARPIWCHALREKADWQFREQRFEQARVIADPRGRVRAYGVFTVEAGNLKVTEVGAETNPAVYANLLRDLAETAKAQNLGQLRLNLPWDHPLALFLTDWGVTFSLYYPRNGGGMARILNLKSCVEKMLPQWNLQTRAAGFRRDMRFEVRTDMGSVSLRCSRGILRLDYGTKPSIRLNIPLGRLTQLLLGYQPTDFILSRRDVRVHGELRPLLRALFPRRYPFLWPHDHF
ncbi:MAG: GNAT family N-acetyltransferase [Planctomycetes bacterium]|nr:GNAT family N-acetyltransferase [Planctomycetota bacterium]